MSAIWRYILLLLCKRCISGARWTVNRLSCYNHALELADVNIKCASTYFRYGAALFYKAQDEQDVFGSSLQAATAHDEADVAEEQESGKQPCCQHCCLLLRDSALPA